MFDWARVNWKINVVLAQSQNSWQVVVKLILCLILNYESNVYNMCYILLTHSFIANPKKYKTNWNHNVGYKGRIMVYMKFGI